MNTPKKIQEMMMWKINIHSKYELFCLSITTSVLSMAEL